MNLLISLAVSLAVGIITTVILFKIFGKQQELQGRLTQYVTHPRRERRTERKSQKGVRGLWVLLGKMAPQRLSDHYSQVLQKASLPVKGEEMASAIGASTVLCTLIGGLLLSAPGWFVGAFVGAKLPGWMLMMHIKRRNRSIEDQLVDFLTLTANAMRAGHSFLQALELGAREMPEPIGVELKRCIREVGLGLTVEDALVRFVERVPSGDIDLMVTAVLIQRQVGGDLASILDNIANTIRERQRIKAEVSTLTAQGRLSGWIISLMPFGLALILNAMNPDYMKALWSDPIGIMMLAMGGFSLAIGTILIRKIVQIDV